MGAVWHARDIFLSAPVALKLLRREHRMAGPQRDYLSERLTREATALARIRHPAIVRVFDFGASSWDDPYLAMELLDGESLGTLLERNCRLIPEYAVQIMLPIAHGLAAAHELGVVHRDLKPYNLFLSIDGRIQPKLIDFGLVKLTNAQSNRKLTGCGLLGTPDYMAPEQALELPNVDHRADVWAFCVVLYEALSGTLPFSKPTFAETLCSLVGRDAAPLTAIGVDPDLWQIIERGFRKLPEERWQTMNELGTALANWLIAKGVTVDVTGAALHTQWPVPVGDHWQPPSEQSPTSAPEPEPDPFPTTSEQRPERRSGLRLRKQVKPRQPIRVSDPDVVVRSANKRLVMRAGFRLALSGAFAAGVMLAPAPEQLVDQARALAGMFGNSEPGDFPGTSDVSRAGDLIDFAPLPMQSAFPQGASHENP